MYERVEKPKESKSRSVAQKKSGVKQGFGFVDNRPEAIAQRKLQEMANNSTQSKQATQLQAMADNHFAEQPPIQTKENNTDLPDNLKSGIENLSGYSMDDVKVHYNSDKPAQLQANAYAQGTDIHVASGQEKHLPHEAWHVVQQKQGRVAPTTQLKGEVNVNDDAGLEREADVMGEKASTILKKTDEKSPSRKKGDSNSNKIHQLSRGNQRIKKQKKQAKRIQFWKQALLQRGFTAPNAAIIANGFANTHHSIIDVIAFSPLVLLHGWNVQNVAALITLFEAGAGGRSAADWIAVAAAVGATNHEANVAAFAVMPNWAVANITALLTLFEAGAGGRSAADWIAVAAAHAGVVDQEAALALITRAGWAVADLTNYFTPAATQGNADVIALFSIAGVAVSTRAMLTGGWAAGNLGIFTGAMRTATLSNAQIAAFLATPNMPAATQAMSASWTPANLAQFVAGAKSVNATDGAIRALMAQGNFPASSNVLAAGGWSGTQVGEFCGSALVANTPAADFQTLIATVNVPAALRAMVTAGWTIPNLGTFCGVARVGGIAPATQLALMQVGNFRTGTVAMQAAAWTPIQIAQFVVGISGTGLAVAAIGAVTNAGGFGANSHGWIVAGFTPQEVGQICGRARQANGGALTPANLSVFLGTGNAAARSFALHGTWGVNEIGTTIGYCFSMGVAPSHAEMVQLLQRAAIAAGNGGAQVQAIWVRNAAQAAACGAPNWAQVIARLVTFQANWVGPRLQANQANLTFNGTRGGNYRIRIRLPGERVRHVEGGHSFEYHLFTYGNCTRPGVGVGGNASFDPVGTNVPAVVIARRNSATAQGLAENAVNNAVYGTNYLTQGLDANYQIGVLPGGAAFGPAYNLIHPTFFSQCYPTAGIQIMGRNLVAIGRFMGQI